MPSLVELSDLAERPDGERAAFGATIDAAGGDARLREEAAGANPFGPVLRKIALGQSAVIQAWTDSTGILTPNRRYFGQLADALIATGRLPATYGLRIFEWAGTSYTLKETVRTGTTTGLWLDLYLASVSGSIPRYFTGVYFFRALAAVTADCMIMAHGLNLATFAAIEGEYIAAVEQYRTAHPATPILALTQHPFQNKPDGETSFRPALLRAGAWDDFVVDDTVYRQVLAAGKPDWFYNNDALHESHGTGFWVPGAQVGTNLYVDVLLGYWDRALPKAPKMRVSSFSIPAAQQQMVANGDFTTWTDTSAAPDGWLVDGTPGYSLVFSKDASIFADRRKPFSVRMVAATQAAYIQQAVSASRVPYLGNGPTTFYALMRKDPDGGQLGRLQVSWSAPSGNGAITSTANNVQQDGFALSCISGIRIPADATSVILRVYADQAVPVAGKGVWLDQVGFVPGYLPMAYR